MIIEIWKNIIIDGEQYPYEVSNIGNVRKGNKILSLQKDGKGYVTVTLSKDGKRRAIFVHRLVLENFKCKCPTGKETNHINGIKDDNRISNLKWVTGSENLLHSYKTGLRSRQSGELHGNAKLSERDILKIRKKYEDGGTSHSKLAKEFNVTRSHIGKIVTRKQWKHI